MMLSVAVLGASGVYGRHLVPRLVAAGHRVRALVRTPEAAAASAANGVEIRAADIFDGAALRAALAGCDVAINLATALPSPAKSGGDFALNDRLRRDGVPVFLAACAEAGVEKVLQQSIAMVHGGGGDAWADEESFFPLPAAGVANQAIAAALEMEAKVRATALDWLILRGGLFYGPGTGFDDEWFARALNGKLRLPETGEHYVTLVHIADMAAATVAALARWPSRQALIVAESEPSRWRDLFGYVARVSNRRAREVLAWSPHYPNHRIGLAR
jgi:nucleoside-diphosphate-sugar epimerase